MDQTMKRLIKLMDAGIKLDQAMSCFSRKETLNNLRLDIEASEGCAGTLEALEHEYYLAQNSTEAEFKVLKLTGVITVYTDEAYRISHLHPSIETIQVMELFGKE